MSKKSSVIGRRAWSLLRLALLFRNRLAVSLHKVIRKLVHSNESRRALLYGDRELSFDKTPIIHVKMNRPSSSLHFKLPHIPCLKPQVDFDCDSEDDETWPHDEDEDEEMNAVDVKAEEFIARFYQQMRLQTQISYLDYNS